MTEEKSPFLEIGNRLVELRKLKRYSQQEAADILKIKQRTYQNYEYGERQPNTGNLKKIIDFYGCDYSWLLTGEGVPYPDQPQEKPEVSGEIQNIFNNHKDLPDDQLTALLDHLKTLSRNDRKRIISDLISSTRRGGIDDVLVNKICAVVLEFLRKKGKSSLDSYDFMFAMTLQTIYRELQKSPNENELMAVIETLYAVGKVFPQGIPLTPHEQAELFSWGQIPAPEEKKDG